MFFALIKNEIEGFSRWFKAVLVIIFVLYVSLWVFTIRLHALQQAQHITPVLPVLAEDSAEYDSLVESMLQGKGFAMDGKLETLRTPGYPAFVAAIKKVSGSYFAVTFAQILVIFLAAIVVRRIGIRFSSRNVGEVAAILLLLNPVTITLTLLIYSDTLFLLLFTSGFYAALSLKKERFLPRILLVSLLFGLAIYVRPIGLLAFPIFIAPIVASHLAPKLKWKAAGITIACIVLLLSPWMLRNYERTGVFSFTSIGASSIGWATARFLANADHVPLDVAYQTLTEKIGVPESGWRDIRLSQKITGVSEGIILARPFSYAKYHLTMALSFLFPSTVAFALDIYHDSIGRPTPFSLGAIHNLASGDLRAFYQGVMQMWWKVLERLVWLAVCIIALFAVWKRRKEPLAWALAFVIAYLMALAGPAAGPRYSLQAFPFLFILFAAGATHLLETYHYFRASK